MAASGISRRRMVRQRTELLKAASPRIKPASVRLEVATAGAEAVLQQWCVAFGAPAGRFLGGSLHDPLRREQAADGTDDHHRLECQLQPAARRQQQCVEEQQQPAGDDRECPLRVRAGTVVVEVGDRNHQQDEQLAVADQGFELHGGSGGANLIHRVVGR